MSFPPVATHSPLRDFLRRIGTLPKCHVTRAERARLWQLLLAGSDAASPTTVDRSHR